MVKNNTILFQLMSCVLRRIFNRDSKLHAIPSGLLAGLTFGFFPDNTIALYVMWKSLQVCIPVLLFLKSSFLFFSILAYFPCFIRKYRHPHLNNFEPFYKLDVDIMPWMPLLLHTNFLPAIISV
jgi:hypothetical protein